MPWVSGGHVGEARGSVRGQREGGNMGRSLYCGFWGKEQVRQGQQAQDWLVWIISGSGAQELALVVWYPALVLRAGDSGLESENHRGGGGLWALGGWFAFERCPTGELSTL